MVTTSNGDIIVLYETTSYSSNRGNYFMIRRFFSTGNYVWSSNSDLDNHSRRPYRPEYFNCFACVVKLIEDDGSRILVGGLNYDQANEESTVGTLDMDASGSDTSTIDQMLVFNNINPFKVEIVDMDIVKYSSSHYRTAICYD